VDLNPRWMKDDATGRTGLGIEFDCPGDCCSHAAQKAQFAVPFMNPLDGGEPFGLGPELGPFLWPRDGDTFETLTLMSDVDSSWNGHWRGFVRDGKVSRHIPIADRAAGDDDAR
jgi:hypothetical protein